MDTVNIILSGLGGQGVLFLTRVIAGTALKKGIDIMGAETHGMARRGGSVVSHLRLGNVQSSLVRSGAAHFLMALEENEAYRNIPFIGKGGRIYANTPSNHFPIQKVRQYLDKMEIVCKSISAEILAVDLGVPMSSNLALLGFFSAFNEGPFTHEELRATIDDISPENFRELNLKVFDTGFQKGVR